MPTELRRLVFSKQELVEAIDSHNRNAAEKLPPGSVASCEVRKEEDNISAAIEITDQQSGETQQVELNAAYLGAALLRFCIDKKIPLPRQSAKSLQVVGDNIALNITKGLVERKLSRKTGEEG